MRKMVVAIVGLGLLTFGAAASGGKIPLAGATTHAAKTAFCAANDSIDKAGASVTSNSGFLAVLKAKRAALEAMEKDAPAGKIGKEVRAIVKAAFAAIAKNNANLLNNVPGGGAVDTYCGVDGNGNPLPAYFAAGKGSPFCSVSSAINAGTQNATDAAGVLAFLAGHQSLITQYASYVPSLPSSIQSDAQYLVTTAQSAISTNNANLLGTEAVSQDSMDVQLYCGQNQ
jgi:hypothetical protein